MEAYVPLPFTAQSVGQVLDDWKVIVAALICQCHLPEQIVHDARKNCHKVSSH